MKSKFLDGINDLDSVYLMANKENENLIGMVVRAENDLGHAIGSGYISDVKFIAQNKIASVRLMIDGQLYVGDLLWDNTRFCSIRLEN